MARHSLDLTEGPVAKKFLMFAPPVLITNIINQFYHSADVMVVGRFAQDSELSLAAVGSSGPITTLLLNVFYGLSMGGNVLCANLLGAKKEKDLLRATQTALIVGFFCGIFIGAAGAIFAEELLILVGSPPAVLPYAATYMRIIFFGVPASLMSTFVVAIMRSHGDTRRPMYITLSSGLINVLLNLLFVIVFHLDSAGVALATIISQYLSCAAFVFILFYDREEFHLRLKEFSFDFGHLRTIMRIGIPGGLNGMVFSISNVVVLSAINSLGPTVIAAKSASESLTGIIYQVIAAMYVSCISLVGQNFGAGKIRRIMKVYQNGILLCTGALLAISAGPLLFPDTFLGIFTKDPDVLAVARQHLYIVGGGYVIYGFSEVALGCSRGMGKSVVPTILNASVICLPRLIWVAAIFPLHRSLGFLLLCYPVSWVMTSIAQFICFYYYYRKNLRKQEALATAFDT